MISALEFKMTYGRAPLPRLHSIVAGLASRWSRLPGLQVMHLYLAILDIHNNLAIDKRAARLIDEVEEQCQMEY